MRSDNHMHTKFSGDSEAEPLAMINSAKQKGLSGLTFTDHLDWDYTSDPGYFDLDIPRYLSEMETLRKSEASEDFFINVGIELGLQTHLAGRHAALLSEHSFDYVIGSIHQLGGEDPYYDSFYEGKSIPEVYSIFLSDTLANLRSFSDIDALGHLDYISRYGQRVAAARGEDGSLSYIDYADVIDEILTFLIGHDIALEVNTGAYRYGYREPNPSFAILSRYRKLGGEMLTLGADAHAPADVGIAFDEVLPRLKELGFSSYFVFEKRTPREVAFDE